MSDFSQKAVLRGLLFKGATPLPQPTLAGSLAPFQPPITRHRRTKKTIYGEL